jgi:hypothetical protein
MKTAKEYIEGNCNKKGEVKVKNISKEQEEGLKEIEDEIKNGDRVVFTSDKTGVLTYDSMNNYLAALDEHIDDDVQVLTKTKYSYK